MLNAFLMSIYNLAALPAQAATPDGDIVLEAGYVPYTPTAVEQPFVAAVLNGLTNYQRFARCLQLVSIVEVTPFAADIIAVDPRVTYTARNIRQHVTASGISGLSAPLATLVGTREWYELRAHIAAGTPNQGQSELDQVASVAAWFGARAWQ